MSKATKEALAELDKAINNLTSAGQIKKGDTVSLRYKGDNISYQVDEVLHSGTDIEEILLSKKLNLYFITSMAIDSNSWAKDVKYTEALAVLEGN